MRRCDDAWHDPTMQSWLFIPSLHPSLATKIFHELKLRMKARWKDSVAQLLSTCMMLQASEEESQTLSDLFSIFLFIFFMYVWRKHPAHEWKIGYLDRDILIPYIFLDSSHLEKKGRGEKRLVFCIAISMAPESFASSLCLLNSWLLNFSSRGARGSSKTLAIVAPPRGDVSLPFTILSKENSKIS